MAKSKESLGEALKKSELGSAVATGGQNQAEAASKSFLELFLGRLKLFAIAKQDHPELRLDSARFKELDANLDSPNAKVRTEALTEIGILAAINESAAEKAAQTTLPQVVDKAQLSDPEKISLKAIAQQVESALADPSIPKTQAELEQIYENLNTLRDGLGEKNLGVTVSTAVGLEYVDTKIKQMQTRRSISEYNKDKEFRTAPIDAYAGQFEAIPKADDPVQVRVAWNPNLKTKVDGFRKNVREELLVADKEQKLAALSGDTALARIKEISELKAHMHELHGEKWVKKDSAQRMDEIRASLTAVQDEYQAELARKIEARLKSQKNGPEVTQHVAYALDKVIERHRQTGRSTYEFGTDDTFDKITQEVLGEAQKMKVEIPRAPAMQGRQSAETLDGMDDLSDGEIAEYRNGEELYDLGRKYEAEKAKKFSKALAGTDYSLASPEFMRDLVQEGGIERVMADMQAHGLEQDNDTLRIVRAGLEDYRKSLTEPMGMGTELSRLLSQEKHAEAINLTMEYLARVGLREASSDWKLAVILRQQKDIISRINPDAAEAFEARQHLLFLPNPNGLSHEKFGEVMAQVLTKGNLDYAFSPSNVFMLGTQIQMGDKKFNINTAMYKDLLRSEEASMRLLNADVNSTDSTLRGILVEHMFGKGAKLDSTGFMLTVPGQEPIDIRKINVKMRFHNINQTDINNYKKLMDEPKDVNLFQMFERTHWMLKDAQQFWWYGREWEKHLVNYPKNKMRNAPKKIASMGRMLGGYNGEFEKMDRSMVDLALLGTMLQPAEVYKLPTTVGTNVRDILLEMYKEKGLFGTTQDGVTYDLARAEAVGNLMVKLVSDRVTLDGEEFTVDVLPLEAARLVGNNIDTKNMGTDFYNLIRGRYLAMNMEGKDIPSQEQMRGYYDSWKNMNIKQRMNVTDEKLKFWGAQAEEMAAWVDMRKFNADNLTSAELALTGNLTAAELKPFLERETMVFGTTRQASNLREFFGGARPNEGIQFTSIMDPKKLDQGDDTFQYGANYYPRALKAADMLVKFFNLESSTEEIVEMIGTMQGYIPADVNRKFATVAEKRFLRAQSIQATPFEVAHQGGKWVTENGKKVWVKSDSPNTIDYITLKDSNGNKWQVKGRYGERAYIKENTKRFHSFAYDQKGKWIYRESDVDVALSALNAKGWITKEKKDDMIASITGVGQGVDNFLKKLGIDTSKGAGRKTRLILTKVIGLIKKHPLFDDPVWAFWSIANELKEYMSEIGKDLTKELAK